MLTYKQVPQTLYSTAKNNNSNNSLLYWIWHHFMLILFCFFGFWCYHICHCHLLPSQNGSKVILHGDLSILQTKHSIQFFRLSVYFLSFMCVCMCVFVWAVVASCLHLAYIFIYLYLFRIFYKMNSLKRFNMRTKPHHTKPASKQTNAWTNRWAQNNSTANNKKKTQKYSKTVKPWCNLRSISSCTVHRLLLYSILYSSTSFSPFYPASSQTTRCVCVCLCAQLAKHYFISISYRHSAHQPTN